MAGLLDSHLATLKSNLHATLSVTFLKHLSNSIPRVSLLRSGPAYPLNYISLHYPLTHSAAVRLSFMQFHSADFSGFAPFVFCCLWLAPITILNISASWNLSTTPDSVGCPSSVLSYYSQLQFSLFSFPLRCEFSKGRRNQWEIEDEVINYFFLERVGLNIYQYKLQAYLCVLDHGSGYSHPAYHRRGKWAVDRTLEKATKVPYMSPRP